MLKNFVYLNLCSMQRFKVAGCCGWFKVVVFSAGPSVRVLTSQHQQLQPVTHAGHIAVIGSTAASRRPAVEEIQTIGTIGADMDV